MIDSWTSRLPLAPRRRVTLAALVALALLACDGGTGSNGATIDASGGSASDLSGRGGSGGSIFLHAFEPSPDDLGIEVRPGGRVDTRLDVPALPPVDTGSNGLVVDHEVQVSSVVFTEPPAGTLYMIKEESQLYVSDGDGLIEDEEAVTGLIVEPGGRLVLPHHFTHQADEVVVVFYDDIVNDGEITTVDLPTRDRGRFGLRSTDRGYRGSGALLAQGLRPGQGGGGISVDVQTDGFNEGDWLAFGVGDNAPGGFIGIAASNDFDAPAGFVNEGRLDVRGGDADGALGVGGDGGDVSLSAGTAFLSTGTIDASGGDGALIAGSGGLVRLGFFFLARDIVIEGDVIADGGRSRDGIGGSGGGIEVTAFAGTIRSTSDLLVRGGSGPKDEGGMGGSILVQTACVYAGPDSLPGGPIQLSGRLLASGGDGLVTGGSGGNIEMILASVSGCPTTSQHIALLGQRAVSAAGGDGHVEGGEGGFVTFDTASNGGSPLGPVVIEVPVDASGGDAGLEGLNLAGGDGGEVELRGLTIERGDVDVSAGTGTVSSTEGVLLEIFP